MIDADRAPSCRLARITFGAAAARRDGATGAGALPLPELPPEAEEDGGKLVAGDGVAGAGDDVRGTGADVGGADRHFLRTNGRPAAQWLRLEAGRSDDLGTASA